MTEFELPDAVAKKLDEHDFEGTDASLQISFFEYGGLYSDKHGCAFLCVPEKPHRCVFDHISWTEIESEMRSAGDGFWGWMGTTIDEEIDRHRPMEMIHSLMMYNGSWFHDSENWSKFTDWKERELLRKIAEL